MRRAPDGSWELTVRKAPLARSLAAAWLLALLGVILGGPVGWVAFAFFGMMGVVLVTRLVDTRVVAAFTPAGVVLAAPGGATQAVAWPAVEALLLWTQPAAAEGRIDHLGVVTAADLPALGVGVGWSEVGSQAPVDLGRVLAVSTSLADCRVDADAVRSALFALGSHAVVVDRRQ